jgi:4-hydroxybenzoyl-CoA reductase subunit alpha
MRPEELRRRSWTSVAAAELVRGRATVIGRRNRKVDGYGKVTGATVYTDDMVLPGMLHGKILRSPHPHARIVSIDTSAAEALPGVHAVVTGATCPSRTASSRGRATSTAVRRPRPLHRRWRGRGRGRGRGHGEPRAALIRVEYELLEPILEPERALEPDAPQIHEPGKPGRNGNITKHVHLEFGDVDAALADSTSSSRASTSSRAPRTRRSSRTAPSAGTTRPAS